MPPLERAEALVVRREVRPAERADPPPRNEHLLEQDQRIHLLAAAVERVIPQRSRLLGHTRAAEHAHTRRPAGDPAVEAGVGAGIEDREVRDDKLLRLRRDAADDFGAADDDALGVAIDHAEHIREPFAVELEELDLLVVGFVALLGEGDAAAAHGRAAAAEALWVGDGRRLHHVVFLRPVDVADVALGALRIVLAQQRQQPVEADVRGRDHVHLAPEDAEGLAHEVLGAEAPLREVLAAARHHERLGHALAVLAHERHQLLRLGRELVVVHLGEYIDAARERRMRRHVVDQLAAVPDLAPVAERLPELRA